MQAITEAQGKYTRALAQVGAWMVSSRTELKPSRGESGFCRGGIYADFALGAATLKFYDTVDLGE